jgi:hypothetical protein
MAHCSESTRWFRVGSIVAGLVLGAALGCPSDEGTTGDTTAGSTTTGGMTTGTCPGPDPDDGCGVSCQCLSGVWECEGPGCFSSTDGGDETTSTSDGTTTGGTTIGGTATEGTTTGGTATEGTTTGGTATEGTTTGGTTTGSTM